MKKLMFAAAIAASAAAFAAPINAISFEDEHYTNGKTFTNGDAEYNDVGDANSKYFCFTGGESNSSVVTNESPSTANDKRTAAFKESTNTKYLALDTEGGKFWRSINAMIETAGEGEGATPTYSLGSAQPIAATGTYLDTLVQFTVTEDEAPETTAGDKLAIWLQAGEGTTNLMVKAKTYIADLENSTLADAVTNYTVAATGITIEPGQWYRLTVKAIPNLLKVTDYGSMCGFQIYIDGQPVKNTSGATFTYADFETYDMITSEMATLMAEGSVFASLGALDDTSLQGVGFQGTGAVDEIVWTEDNPLPAPKIDFTLTWGEGVSAVSYTLSTDLTTTNALTSGTAVQLAPGDGTATIELIPTFASDYEFDKVTMGETDLGLTFAIPGVATNATLLAKAAAAAYPTYIDTTDTAITAKYDAWKQAVGFDDSSTSTHLNQFLLNVDEATTVGNTALTITEIKENATAGWDITIGCTVSGASLTGTVGETIVCNGYLSVSYTDDLTGTWTTENIAVTAVDATAGTVTVNVNKANAKFMKVTLTAAPQAAANN